VWSLKSPRFHCDRRPTGTRDSDSDASGTRLYIVYIHVLGHDSIYLERYVLSKYMPCLQLRAVSSLILVCVQRTILGLLFFRTSGSTTGTLCIFLLSMILPRISGTAIDPYDSAIYIRSLKCSDFTQGTLFSIMGCHGSVVLVGDVNISAQPFDAISNCSAHSCPVLLILPNQTTRLIS
jgi:hypothetical protein